MIIPEIFSKALASKSIDNFIYINGKMPQELSLNDVTKLLSDPLHTMQLLDGECDKHILECDKHILLQNIIDTMQACFPKAMDSFHKKSIVQCIEGLKNLCAANYHASSLLPPPSDLYMSMFADQFLALQLANWAEYLINPASADVDPCDKELPVIDKTQYLFITWDLRDLAKWEDFHLDKLGIMLEPLAEQTVKQDNTQESKMLIHRLVFLRKSQLDINNPLCDKFFNEIWFRYFQPWTYLPNEYYLYFINVDEVEKNLKNGKFENDLLKLMDLALFSFDPAIRLAANKFVLPSRVSANDAHTEYSVVQFSNQPDCKWASKKDYFMMYLLQAETADAIGYISAKNEIAQRRLETIEVFEKLKLKLKKYGLNNTIKTCSIEWLAKCNKTKLSQLANMLKITLKTKTEADLALKKLCMDGIKFETLEINFE